MDRGSWQATVHGVTKNRAWLSDLTFLGSFVAALTNIIVIEYILKDICNISQLSAE